MTIAAGHRGDKTIEILKVNRSEGVVIRSPAFRKNTRTLRCKEYFYGPRGNLMPHSQTIKFNELRMFKIGGNARAPTSALPIGELDLTLCLDAGWQTNSTFNVPIPSYGKVLRVPTTSYATTWENLWAALYRCPIRGRPVAYNASNTIRQGADADFGSSLPCCISRRALDKQHRWLLVHHKYRHDRKYDNISGTLPGKNAEQVLTRWHIEILSRLMSATALYIYAVSAPDGHLRIRSAYSHMSARLDQEGWLGPRATPVSLQAVFSLNTLQSAETEVTGFDP